MAPTCASLRGVSKHFDGFAALEDVDLDLPAGALSAVVGASGSGKSTLLQLVNAVLDADAGEVRVFGAPVPATGRPAFRRRIGYAVQGAGLFPHLSVRDNVLIPARIAGWDRDRSEARLRELLEVMGVALPLADRYPHQLSGGQQQRIGLCRALLLQPELLLLDEPFSALDPVTRSDLQTHFRDLQQAQALSTVMVTHDMHEALAMAQYLVVLQSGRVLRAGARDEVLSDPRDDYVRRLLEELGR